MKQSSPNNDKGKRIKLYLKYKTYFDQRVLHDLKWKQKGPIAISYISTDKTLKQVGIENALGPERVRQIVAEFLRKILRIYTKNKKELENMSETQIDRLFEENKKLKRKIEMYERIINNDLEGVSQAALLLQEATAKMISYQEHNAAVNLGRLGGKVGGPARALALSPERRKEISTNAVNARWNKRSKPTITPIVDDGETGYLLTDIKDYLGADYERFLSWYKGRTGGIIAGDLYVFTKDFEEFLKIKQLTNML